MASVKPRTINEIKTNLLNPALTSHFHVNIGTPFNGGGTFNSFISETGCNYKQDQLNLMCCETALPGSQLATTELLNDFPGVTERHVYRRQFDDRIDLNFYCDAEQYLPIRFFEGWIKYITNERVSQVAKENYSYRMRFPNTYKGPLEITKFEKNIHSRKRVRPLTYRFVNCFPLAISSMPVTYDASDLLKCNVSFAYSRYYIDTSTSVSEFLNPAAQATFNNSSFGFPIGGIPKIPAMKSGNQDPTWGMNDQLRSVWADGGFA
jgi:hypothetical protein